MAKIYRRLFVSFFQANIYRYKSIFCGLMDCLIYKMKISKELVKEKQKMITYFLQYFLASKMLGTICLKENSRIHVRKGFWLGE